MLTTRWADMIVTTGGDGTFLMGSSKILNRSKPVIGINTDPTRWRILLCCRVAVLSYWECSGARVIFAFRSTFRSMWKRRSRVLSRETSDGSSGISFDFYICTLDPQGVSNQEPFLSFCFPMPCQQEASKNNFDRWQEEDKPISSWAQRPAASISWV